MGVPLWYKDSDVTQHLDQVDKIYAAYDPYIEQDRLHIERIQHPNLVPLKAIGLGHKSAMVLRRMDQLKPIMSRRHQRHADAIGILPTQS